MENNSKSRVYLPLYIALCAVVSLPLMCNYIPESGDIRMWLARVDELSNALKGGRLLLFPTAETVLAYAGQYNALDSNVWLFVPAAMSLVTGNVVFSYRAFVLLLQVGTLLFSVGLFRKVFQSEEAVFFATLFYLTVPYRLYLVYDGVNWARSIAFMLLPLFVRLVIGVYTDTGKRKWCFLLGGAFAWAGIAYADWVVAFLLLAITALSILWYRKWWGFLVPALGIVIYLPGLRYVARYLIKGGMEQWNFPLVSIMPNGYSLGRFFTAFTYRGEQPGLGLGLLGALMILFGLCYVKEHFRWDRKYNFPLSLAVVFMIAASEFFPWDLLQRVGMPFVRMVSLWESPAVFFGCAMLPLSILGAYAMESLPKNENAAKAIKFAVAIAGMGIAVLLCNAYVGKSIPLVWG